MQEMSTVDLISNEEKTAFKSPFFATMGRIPQQRFDMKEPHSMSLEAIVGWFILVPLDICVGHLVAISLTARLIP